MIKGLAFLSISFILGMWTGELLGSWLGIHANVGGVGFAMIFLILSKEYFTRRGWWKSELEFGIEFWNKLYIPVVIAMAASLNVKSAISSGTLAIFAGIVPVIIAFAVFYFMMKSFKTT
ncbi:MAG: malonate transporter subunit MadL [Algoriphagus sp.]|uniref:malonate transporter subunit MadL n=1 Tax=Algoriphagus sp. TaxID=1872435 RepID=UPI00272196D2|nr:malonate transporter subunit MadL [Algoriphagus sp.]MDO8966422.1 malonate transporter subunit MadL [Algoriphagus sp.]MDP2040712.1 malonate transporter subunit MadL [Algoriphagus sp.]MDP3202369.1 malonate transporter subunit MadL [Algoriphagus sp.]MDP3471890.1 malonate transporter subunit MadL [Algoriphagus sp.]